MSRVRATIFQERHDSLHTSWRACLWRQNCLSYDKFSCQPNKSILLAIEYGQQIEGQSIKTRIFENNVILPTGYNRGHIKEMLESGILEHNFRVVGSPADGFCLLHSFCLSLQSQFPDSHPLSINEFIRILKCVRRSRQWGFINALSGKSFHETAKTAGIQPQMSW